MSFSMFELTYIDGASWWIEICRLELSDRQGFALLLGRNDGLWEIDFLWLGLLNIRFT